MLEGPLSSQDLGFKASSFEVGIGFSLGLAVGWTRLSRCASKAGV